ncbi:MAG: beta-galactosidase family protein [Acutalibacteraceae bacterium]|nr:beta-galactosidase family protein [Acutalibacteraceae bacterium]
MTFEIKGNQFYKNGEAVKIISGAVHYFRNMPDTWGDIFKKMRAMGLNCVETYCAWNQHEKKPGEFDFSGMLDIASFIRAAGEAGLMVIVRPGPYICAELEFGGLPWWIQSDDEMEIRCSNAAYIKCFDRYLDRLLGEVRPLLCTNGGPVIMLQCENEYGYYGDDKKYLQYLYEGYRKRGIDVPLFTSDGTSRENLLDGAIDGCLATLNFGSRVEENFKAHDELFPDMPKVCMEMWNGWFDAWGDSEHHTTSAEDYATIVDDMLHKGSVNMYMFIGGTNFGFTSGANHYERFAPDVTSYDYDALLTECGDVTEKYRLVREVIRKHTNADLPEIPADREKRAYGRFILNKYAGIFDNMENLSSPQYSDVPKCMEKYGQGYGFIAYTTTLNRDYNDVTLSFESLGDRAQIYINKSLVGIVYINDSLEIKISAKAGDVLTVLCENMGRANFGSKMMRKKGIAGRCLIDKKIHFGWSVYPLPMDNLCNISYGDELPEEKSVFLKGVFTVDKVCDTFLKLDNFTKGFVVINGFNIGRYWEIGPQRTLYVPASLLKEGENEIVIFESDGMKGTPEIEFVDKPVLG